jgi:serpin B
VVTMGTTGNRRASRRATWAVGLLVLAALLAACSGSSTGTEIRADTPRAQIDRSTLGGIVEANSQLATDLYAQLARDHQNFTFSPFAISLALGQIGVGAAGVTATQLDAVQHVSSQSQLQSGLNSLSLQVDSRSGDRQSDVRQGHISVQIPVSLWGQLQTQIKMPFLAQLSRWFGTGMRMVDYRSDPGSARTAINNWVSDQSSSLFDEIIPPGQISDATRLVLTSAAVISAPWDQRFDATRTRQAPFQLTSGRTEDVTTMSITSPVGLLYAKGSDWQAVMLPYLGRQLAMVVIVPNSGQLGTVEDHLDGVQLQAILDQLQPTPLELEMPRFELSTRLDLNQVVSALGAPSLFDVNQAALPGVTADENLAVSNFDEQSFVSADEEGTQASAPTAVRNGRPTSPPTTSLDIDRPFLVAVAVASSTGAAPAVPTTHRPNEPSSRSAARTSTTSPGSIAWRYSSSARNGAVTCGRAASASSTTAQVAALFTWPSQSKSVARSDHGRAVADVGISAGCCNRADTRRPWAASP